MPYTANGWTIVVSLVFLQKLGTLPIPNVQFPLAITTDQKLSIWAERRFTGVSCHLMTGKRLFLLNGKAIPRLKDTNTLRQSDDRTW